MCQSGRRNYGLSLCLSFHQILRWPVTGGCCHDRVRHGHRCAARSLCGSLHPQQVNRGVLTELPSPQYVMQTWSRAHNPTQLRRHQAFQHRRLWRWSVALSGRHMQCVDTLLRVFLASIMDGSCPRKGSSDSWRGLSALVEALIRQPSCVATKAELLTLDKCCNDCLEGNKTAVAHQQVPFRARLATRHGRPLDISNTDGTR